MKYKDIEELNTYLEEEHTIITDVYLVNLMDQAVLLLLRLFQSVTKKDEESDYGCFQCNRNI